MKCKSGKNRGKRNACFFLGILSLVTVVLCLSASCNADGRKAQKYVYGVFLNADRTAVPKLKNYETVVIDAQYFSKKDIRKLHADGDFKENPGNGEAGSGQWRRYLCDGISVPLWFCCGYYDGCKPGVGVEQD